MSAGDWHVLPCTYLACYYLESVNAMSAIRAACTYLQGLVAEQDLGF